MYREEGIALAPALVAKHEQKAQLERYRQAIEESNKEAAIIMRKRCVPDWLCSLMKEVANDHGVHVCELLGEGRGKEVVNARHHAIYLTKATKPGLSSPQIGKWFNRDHTAILHALTVFARRNDLPAFTSAGRR